MSPPPPRARHRDRVLGAGEGCDELVDLIRRALFLEISQDDADGLSGSGGIEAGLLRDPCDKLFHVILPQSPVSEDSSPRRGPNSRAPDSEIWKPLA